MVCADLPEATLYFELFILTMTKFDVLVTSRNMRGKLRTISGSSGDLNIVVRSSSGTIHAHWVIQTRSWTPSNAI